MTWVHPKLPNLSTVCSEASTQAARDRAIVIRGWATDAMRGYTTYQCECALNTLTPGVNWVGSGKNGMADAIAKNENGMTDDTPEELHEVLVDCHGDTL